MREVTRIVAYIADGPIDIQAELAALQAKRDAIRNRMCLVPWKFYPRTLFFTILGFYHANTAYMTAEIKFKIQVPTASYLRPKWPLKRCRCSCAHAYVQNTLNYHDSYQTSFSFTLMTPHGLLCFRENILRAHKCTATGSVLRAATGLPVTLRPLRYASSVQRYIALACFSTWTSRPVW